MTRKATAKAITENDASGHPWLVDDSQYYRQRLAWLTIKRTALLGPERHTFSYSLSDKVMQEGPREWSWRKAINLISCASTLPGPKKLRRYLSDLRPAPLP